MTRPAFYNESQAGEFFLPRYDMVMQEASKVTGKPARLDTFRVGVLGIDAQIGFCYPKASLFVPGAVEDVTRACNFLLDNMDVITNLYFTLDTHRTFQVFFNTLFINDAGQHPEPYTMISAADIDSGKWQPVTQPREIRDYAAQLESLGKYILTIWPFHTMLGSPDHALMPSLYEVAMYHSIVRQIPTTFETKGYHPLTENYSVLAPEVKKILGRSIAQFNTQFFETLTNNDRLYIWGEAKSHCVMWTIKDLLRNLQATDPAMINKVYILEDCMSPVAAVPGADFPAIAEQTMEEFRAAGMNIVKSTDPVIIEQRANIY